MYMLSHFNVSYYSFTLFVLTLDPLPGSLTHQHTPVIPVLGRLKQQDQEFKDLLGCVASLKPD